MRKVIYICDKCGVETENVLKTWYLRIKDADELTSYSKLLCPECSEEIKRLIENNLMVIDPEDLYKGGCK